MTTWKIWPWIRALIVLTAAGCAASAPSPSPPAEHSLILGRWAVSFPDWGWQTIMEFATDCAGSGTAGFLGPSGEVRLRDPRIRGDEIRVRAVAGGRKLTVTAVARGDRLAGRWHVDHLIYRLFGKGEFSGTPVPPSNLAPLAGNMAAFDSLWSVMTRGYYDPGFNGQDWSDLGLHAQAAVANACTDAAAYEVFSGALAALGSSHLYLAATPVATTPPAATPAAMTAALPKRKESAVRWKILSSGLGYIRIVHFRDESPRARAAVDSAFAAVGSQPGLIIDLRGNPGGSLTLANRLGDHLSERVIPVGYFVSRLGLENRGLNSIDELDPATLPRLAAGDSIRADNFFELLDRLGGAALLMTGGGVERPYLERVALLVDRGTASTAEAVAAALQETGRAVVIGSRTAGTMLAARPIEIATGWTLTLPLVDFRTWGGVRVERVGVEPDIAVSPARKGDPVLQRAVEVLTSGR